MLFISKSKKMVYYLYSVLYDVAMFTGIITGTGKITKIKQDTGNRSAIKVSVDLGKNSKGKMSVTRLELSPKVSFSDKFTVDPNEMKKVQDRAHRYCFIANSLSDEVKVLIN